MTRPERRRRLTGKVAVVTGASRGLGQYCALALAFEGARVAVIGRNAAETPLHLPGNVRLTAEGVAEATGAETLPVVCDVADSAAVEAMVATVLDRWGQIDILLNNAAFTMPEGDAASRIPPRLLEQMLRVNVLGTYQTIHAVLPSMRARGRGSIINVSGRSVRRGSPLEATKAAVEALTTGLAEELRAPNIAVNCIRPVDFIATPGVLINDDVAPGRALRPDSYLEALVLLCREGADTYTGQIGTDAEVLRELAEPEVFERYAQLNPPSWAASLEPAARGA